MIELYTDGACIGNPGPGGWGAVLLRNGQITEISGNQPGTTNNQMEITAVIKGLSLLPAGEAVCVVSDSTYVINTMTKGWKRNANRPLWEELDVAVNQREVTWRWVKGHSGNLHNDIADRLAHDAARDLADSAQTVTGPSNDVTNDAADAASDAASQTEQLGLTHVDERGNVKMVDVGNKAMTVREAIARGYVVMQPRTLHLIQQGEFEKGDVVGLARTAGIMGAKNTDELIPLCHSIPLTHIDVDIDVDSFDDRAQITATVRAMWKTGVEMEALTAVSVAALTMYDMAKAVDRGMRIENVKLLSKRGGRSGDFVADDA